jgi:hypothetical protein
LVLVRLVHLLLEEHEVLAEVTLLYLAQDLQQSLQWVVVLAASMEMQQTLLVKTVDLVVAVDHMVEIVLAVLVFIQEVHLLV